MSDHRIVEELSIEELEEVIAILNRNGIATLDQIASELDTTPEMITQLIEYLERINLLKQMGRDCNIQCNGCYLASACDHIEQNRI